MSREYDQVPFDNNTDNLVPPVSDIPNFLSRVAHPKRARSISIGPQSAADVYETLALRQEMRQERRQSGNATTSGADCQALEEPRSLNKHGGAIFLTALPTPSSSSHDLLSITSSMNHETRPLTPDSSTDGGYILARTPSQDRRLDEKEESELFAQISKPRVRYDVEVVTKLLVYGGEI